MTPAGDRPLVPELEGLLAKATPLPWKACPSIEWDFFSIYPRTGKQEFPIASEPLLEGKRYLKADRLQADFALIVAAVNALPQLLALLKAAQADGERVAALEAENALLRESGAEAVIAYHVAICSPKGIVPNDSLYDPDIAARIERDMDARRAALSEGSQS